MKAFLLSALLATPALAQVYEENPPPPPNMSNSPDKILEACSIQAGVPTPQQFRAGARPAPPTQFQQAVLNECLRRSGVDPNPPPTPVDPPTSPIEVQSIVSSCSVEVGVQSPQYIRDNSQQGAFDACLLRNGVKQTVETTNIR